MTTDHRGWFLVNCPHPFCVAVRKIVWPLLAGGALAFITLEVIRHANR
jgi:hypothetical protein